MSTKFYKTKYPSVYYINSKKQGKVFYIKYKVNNISKRKRVGSELEGFTAEKALKELLKIKEQDTYTRIQKERSKTKNSNPSFHFLVIYYFKKMEELAKQEEHLPIKERQYKTLQNIKKEKSIYNSFFKDFKYKLIPIKQLNKEQVKNYIIKKQKEEGYSQKYCYNALTFCKSVFKHTQELHNLKEDQNPFKFSTKQDRQKFEKAKTNARQRFLTPQECNLLLDYLKNHDTYQNYLIVYLSLITGARPNTILNIQLKDINLQQNFLNLYDFKRKMYYKIKITQKTADLIKKQIAGRKQKDLYLFYNNKKGQGEQSLKSYPRPIKRILDNMFNKNSKEEEKIVPYSFRHTFANILLHYKNVNVFYVSKLLNHADINTTIKNYLTYNTEDTKEILQNLEEEIVENKTQNIKTELIKRIKNLNINQKEKDTLLSLLKSL